MRALREFDHSSTVNTDTVTRLVVWSHVLFTAGNSLTTGGFLYYFVYEFQQSAFYLAAIHVVPEASEAFGFVTRSILAHVRSRKWLWISALLLARGFALIIPMTLLVFPEQFGPAALSVILISVILWNLAQGIAYCSYISWLSELVPETNWGQFFAKRRIAGLAISIVVPTTAGLIRSNQLADLEKQWETWSYVVIFVIGGLLVVASIIPMLCLPDRLVETSKIWSGILNLSNVSVSSQFKWLLASRWWLAFFQGMTQAVFFKYRIVVLDISLQQFYVFSAIMLSLQIMTAHWAGMMCDRSKDRLVTISGLILVSFAMPFWVAAKPETWWLLYGAYILWGAFGFVNVGLQNLTLKLAPEDDNSLHISMSRQFSGLIAAATGLAGGLCLDSLLESNHWSGLSAFHLLFIISFFGRLSAAIFLLPVRQPEVREHTEQ